MSRPTREELNDALTALGDLNRMAWRMVEAANAVLNVSVSHPANCWYCRSALRKAVEDFKMLGTAQPEVPND